MQAMKIVPTEVKHEAGDARAVAVAKFRELADRLERNELRGARVEWREGAVGIVAVELDETEVRFQTTTTEK